MIEYIGFISKENEVCIDEHQPIVRCRDCKYNELQIVVYSSKPLSVCTAEWCEGAEGDNPLVEPDGFCAWGKKFKVRN